MTKMERWTPPSDEFDSIKDMARMVPPPMAPGPLSSRCSFYAHVSQSAKPNIANQMCVTPQNQVSTSPNAGQNYPSQSNSSVLFYGQGSATTSRGVGDNSEPPRKVPRYSN